MGTRVLAARAAAVLGAGMMLAACEVDRPPETPGSPPWPEEAPPGAGTATATDDGKALVEDEPETPDVDAGPLETPPPAPEPAPAEPGVPRTGKLCGGIGGLPCPPGYQCVDDPRDDCDPHHGSQDCTGVCQPGTATPPP